jgi:hypothetical protein
LHPKGNLPGFIKSHDRRMPVQVTVLVMQLNRTASGMLRNCFSVRRFIEGNHVCIHSR